MKLRYMKKNAQNIKWLTGQEPIRVISSDIEVRLASSDEEIKAAQALRYQVFFEEMGATPSKKAKKLLRDFDEFDDVCDHLLAFDMTKTGPDSIVATYRLLREEIIEAPEDFYSASEFDLSNLFKPAFKKKMDGGQFLELGRSCVRKEYRTNNTMQLMWRAIARYVEKHNVSFLFGCASLPSVNQDDLKIPLSYLHHNYKTPDEFNVPALSENSPKNGSF